ncbi:MAG: hypothetical protein C4518_14320 [Desulfobacteraceae bacterium]|nr:MAG: hypothetical protein C4518_14320 [Desulfobacteraceae bacterium]
MKKKIWLMMLVCLLGMVSSSHATQLHGNPEGLYVHQVSHLFFACCMAILIYWLRVRDLIRSSGWRYIQYGALFFIVWSLDAALAHFLDEQMAETLTVRAGTWHIRMETANVWLGWLYYFVKLDHLFCAPGMILLYIGLKKLHLQNFTQEEEHGEAI